MAVYCKDCEIGLTDICDFCKYFNDDNTKSGGYGYCKLYNERRHVVDKCSYFYCKFK